MGVDIQSLRRQVALVVDNTVSPEAFRARHASVAREQLAKLEGEQGKYPTTTYVDGRAGAKEDDVKLGGVIEYRISPLGDVLDDIYRALLEHSPFGPAEHGHYQDDHWIYVNGQRRDAHGEGMFIDIPAGAEVVFVNARPYARKIEGTPGRSAISAQAPNGVYEITAIAMARKYGNVCKIEYDYRGVFDGNLPNQNSDSLKVRRTANKSQNRFPAITVRVPR